MHEDETQGTPETAPWYGEAQPGCAAHPRQSAQGGEDAPDIFAERLNGLMEVFGDGCCKAGVELAVAVAVNPQTGSTTVFIRGEAYPAAKVVKSLLEQLKEAVMADLA